MTKTEWLKVALDVQEKNKVLLEQSAALKDKINSLYEYTIYNLVDNRFFGDVEELENRFTEILEILGVLLDNAKECVLCLGQESPTIGVSIVESSDNLFICIKNVSEYKTYKDIENMFQMGFSTKGENRGIGLYSVKELLNNNNIDIRVENINDKQVNWLSISIEIPKCNQATH